MKQVWQPTHPWPRSARSPTHSQAGRHLTRATRLQAWLACTALASALAVTAPVALAQTDTPGAAASAGNVADNGAANVVQAPSTPLAQVGKLTLDQQVHWLRQAQQSGTLEKLDDAQLVALFQSLDPLTLPRYIKEGPSGYPSYEFTMLRWERLKGAWPDKPDHMLVRIAHGPLRIYAKWLPDGAHSGQEIIYDESRRSDEMYGHLGGLLGVMPLWTSTTGALARAQSNHQVRDLGTEYITDQFLAEGKKYVEAGVPRSTQIAVQTIEGVRVVTFTYETPIGQPQFYAKKETLGLDLRHPYFRTVESYANDGKIFERIVFESITAKNLDDTAFDPKNPAYKF
ncbi:DUF1571 domain-containing protein [Paraburkholderia phenazinium]|jgi:hypothetical protein|uniref:DUF1571 domain-containing protein n=1 Tax=Paraburkholderia phenazinium TaxID=60549 RepID=A0A1G8EMQ4_9BURK|nr:DUF1571 domain-containing protein [Paraburkholderia phenazinium]SDH71148.1 Protein of unknown function [Paraburkholderia phenazinium]